MKGGIVKLLENVIKNSSESISFLKLRLKYHQHTTRSDAGISLEIILNVFKCFIIPLHDNSFGFLFPLAPSVMHVFFLRWQ